MYRHTSRVCNKKIYDVVSNHNRLVYHYLKIFYFLREFNIRRTGKDNSYQLNSNRIIGFWFLESNIVWSWKRINNGSSKSNWHKFEIVEVFCRATTIMQLCDLICSTKSCSQKAFFFILLSFYVCAIHFFKSISQINVWYGSRHWICGCQFCLYIQTSFWTSCHLKFELSRWLSK